MRVGAITSAADLVPITLHGPGGHTARPAAAPSTSSRSRAGSPTELPGALRALDPSLNLVFGAFHAGDAANVIPATAALRGTLRTPDRDGLGRGARRCSAPRCDALVGADRRDLRAARTTVASRRW